jgi:hypothetical protein
VLELHRDYFATHRVAAAFRWERLGVAATGVGDHRLARAAFARSFRLHPDPSGLWHLARSAGRALTAPQAEGRSADDPQRV